MPGTAKGDVEIDEGTLPPMPPHVLAAFRRMWRDPELFDAYDEEDWLAFAGEEIVAAAPSLDDLYRILGEMGNPEVFIVPVSPAHP
jgi:hypothetical protein